MQPLSTLIILAILPSLPTTIYSIEHPRSMGEPFSPTKGASRLAALGRALLVVSTILLASAN